jgi:hypothetical protein
MIMMRRLENASDFWRGIGWIDAGAKFFNSHRRGGLSNVAS